jgi:hypothetical protein
MSFWLPLAGCNFVSREFRDGAFETYEGNILAKKYVSRVIVQMFRLKAATGREGTYELHRDGVVDV